MAKLENKNTNNEELINDKPVIKKKRSLFLTILSTASYSIIALVALILIIINLPFTKRYIANQAIDFLNKDLKMGMSIDDIDVNFFGDVTIKGLHIKDYKGNEFVKAKEMRVASDWMALAFNTRDIKFNQATVIEPTIRVITYKGDSISNFIRYVDNFDDGKPRDPKRKPFKMGMKFDIINGIASIINENSPGEAGKWLDARKVNLNVTSLKVEGADVSADIRNFNFITKRYGKEHIVDTFSTNFELTKKHLKLGNLTFNTDHSLLQGEVTMNLDPVTKFGDFGNKVKWDLKMIPGSQISGYDLSYFVPDWDNYTPINISGTMTGPLNDFTLNNFLIRSQEINLNTNKMTISSVLDKKFFIESKNVSADFTYKGLKLSLPKFISSKMGNFADDFGRLKYNGSVRVNPKQVYATGNMITGIGQAKVTNFNLIDYSTKRPKYRGLAEVKDLNVTALTKNKQVGLISGKFNVQGEGFDVNTMYVKTTSDVNHINLMGKSLNNISIDGILNKKRFTGNVNSNDVHVKGTFKGFVDFSTKRLLADFDADIKNVDLNYFGVSAGDTNSVSGHLVGKAAMTNLNDLNLDTSIQNLTLNSSSQKLHIPDSKIKAFFENGNRIVSVDAPGAVNGRISGRFDLEDIGNMITNSINKIMVGNPPKKTYNGQNFDFDFDVKQGLVSFFVPNLELPDGAKVAGKYDGNTNDLILNADATKIKYVMTSKKELTEAEKFLAETDATYQPDLTKTKDSAMVDSLRLRVNTANFEKQLDLYAKRAQYAKNVLRDVDFVAANRNSQVLYISTTFELGTLDDEAAKKMKEYAVNINQTTNSAGDYVFRFEPTTITFNNVAWSVDTSPELNHSITYRNKEKDFIVQNLRIFSDESELLVKNADFKSAKDFTADAEVKNFDISKLLALGNGGENDLDIKGTANGTILLRKSGNNLEPLVDLDIENIFMNDKAMGNIETRITKSEKPNVFDVNIQALSSDLLGHNTLDVTGTIDNNPSSPVLDVSAKMDEFDLAFAQQFVKQIFGNFRGKATGDLKISGPMNDLDYSGDIALKGFGLKLLFTGVDYSFDDTVINLSRGLALLNNIAIKDGRSNSKGSISGSIQFETLSSLGVNLIMRADNLLVLNSTQEENDLFWGRVYGEGDVYVSGPVSGLEISTPNDGLKVINNSTFTFNSASTANVDEFKILRFLKRDEAGGISIEKKKQSGANMLIDFDVSIDKNSMVNVLVGDDVGSIAVKGDANHLKFRMERSGNILMNGTYTVDNGTFVSKAILDRTFQIARGSLIRWTGSPMLPDLDIKANYTRPITNTGEYLGMSLTQPVNIVLTTKITGTLTKPDIAFGVSAPDVSSQVRETLAEKMTNQDERVMQFGSILVLNSFNVASSGVPINVGNTALSQGVNMAFKQLGSVLNTISSNFQVNLDYITGDLGSNTSDRANTSVSLALSPRINFKTGLGVPIARTENTNSNYLSAEGTIEYDFSRANNGSRLLRAYSKPSNFGLGTATANALNQSYGVGVVYSRSFNSFRGLFRKRKNRDKTKSDTVAVGQNKEDSLKNKPIK